MGIKIDVEKQRESWATTFTSVQTTLRFCNLDHVEAGKTTRKMIGSDILDETGSHWAESVEYLESIVATMKAPLVRLEISEDRVLRRTRRRTHANETGRYSRGRDRIHGEQAYRVGRRRGARGY
jgi:hypothetical protein